MKSFELKNSRPWHRSIPKIVTLHPWLSSSPRYMLGSFRGFAMRFVIAHGVGLISSFSWLLL
ncbi:hypothetical protein STSO111631_09520 [Stackebrandtia soli]